MGFSLVGSLQPMGLRRDEVPRYESIDH